MRIKNVIEIIGLIIFFGNLSFFNLFCNIGICFMFLVIFIIIIIINSSQGL